MNEYDLAFQKLESEAHLVGDLVKVINGLTETIWNDELFDEQHYGRAALLTRKEIDINTSVNVGKLFLGVYLGCNSLSEEIKLKDLYFSLLPRIKIGNKSAIDSSKATEDQTTAVPKTMIVSSYEFLKCSTPSKTYNTLTGRYTFTASNINDWLQRMITLAESPDQKQLFINMVGFIMMSTLALITNDEQSLDRHLPMGAYRSFQRLYKSFSGVTNCPFPPPHASFYKSCQRFFHQRNNLNTRSLLALLVHSYIINEDNPDVLELLDAGCLQTLHGHGLGAITWSYKLVDKSKVELSTLLPYFNGGRMRETVRRITKFINNPQPKSWPWCRLFEDGAMYSLSTAINSQYCLICAYIVMDDTSVIPQMLQFKKCHDIMEHSSRLAAKYIRYFTDHGFIDHGESTKRSCVKTHQS